MEDWPVVHVPIPPWLWEAAQKHLRKQNPAPEIRVSVVNAWKNGGIIDMSWAGTPANKQTAIDNRLDKLMREAEAEAPKAIGRPPSPAPLRYWPSIEEMHANLPAVVEKYLRDNPDIWWRQEYAPSGTMLDKTAEDIKYFLNDILGMQWEDLTGHQMNYMNLIRRIHQTWWRNQNG